jgi:endonuclease/exonuclease/phosphatase family metal-dependent hydrolase
LAGQVASQIMIHPQSLIADDVDIALAAPKATERLRLLSHNVQAGIATTRYHHYLTHSWRHVLPCPRRLDNLDRIASLFESFDIVGLQEVDGGSLRSGFINLTEYLALQARFPWWYDQTNRDLGKFAQHSLGILSRFVPSEVTELRLPGMIPGRGALATRFGFGSGSLLVVIAHLALGRRARLRQLGYLADVIQGERHVVLMGDLNCEAHSLEMNWLLNRTDLHAPAHRLLTFPSWRPQRHLDHILVSPTLNVHEVRVVNLPVSDHLPIAMDVSLPAALHLPRAAASLRADVNVTAAVASA